MARVVPRATAVLILLFRERLRSIIMLAIVTGSSQETSAMVRFAFQRTDEKNLNKKLQIVEKVEPEALSRVGSSNLNYNGHVVV